jgi:hypothetical protein
MIDDVQHHPSYVPFTVVVGYGQQSQRDDNNDVDCRAKRRDFGVSAILDVRDSLFNQ